MEAIVHAINLHRTEIFSDALIREHKIDSNSASSLINDITFAQSISKKLLTCAATLWVRDEEIKDLGDEYG